MEQIHPQAVSLSKQTGAILIIAGTAIGAGMIGIPYAVAAVGFKTALILLLINWIVMMLSALLIVEVNIKQPLSADLNTMAKATLGRSGQLINWFAYLLLLYSLTTAYISMGESLVDQYILHLSSSDASWYGALLFCFILGFVIFFGTRVVDQLNRVFLTLKAICFIVLVIVIVRHTQKQLLASGGLGSSYAWYAFPILIASFGFHIVIPTIRNYFKNDKKLKQTVIIGSIVPLIVYIVWVFVTLGVIPLMGAYGFNEIIHQGVSLGQAYQNLLQTRMITGLIVAFTNIAVTTSFLGVTLALFHFNQDAYKFKKSQSKRIINFLITFAHPL